MSSFGIQRPIALNLDEVQSDGTIVLEKSTTNHEREQASRKTEAPTGIIEALKITEFYNTLLNVPSDYRAHEYYKPQLDKLMKDFGYVHPNEVMVRLEYLSEREYIELFKDKLSLFDVEANISNYKRINIHQVMDPRVNHAQTIKMLVENIKEQRIVPIGYRSDTRILEWAQCEPDHLTAEEIIEPSRHMVNLKTAGLAVATSSRNLSADRVVFRIVPRTAFIRLVTEFCGDNDITMPIESAWTVPLQAFIEKVLADSLVAKASDVYFYAEPNGLGLGRSVLNDYVYLGCKKIPDLELNTVRDIIIKLCGVNPNDLKEEKIRDYDMNAVAGVERYRGRVNLLPNRRLDAINIRFIDAEKSEIPFAKLNIHESKKADIKKMIDNRSGVLLISGATGSGKSTTVRSMLGLIRDTYPTKRIETVEKPLESIVPGVSQIGLTEGSNIGFKDVGTALTRRNAQVLNIQEINTGELVKFTITISLQQLFIISTIHSSDVPAIPARVKGMLDTDRGLLPDFLSVARGFIHQTMMKEICPDCKKTVGIQESSEITTDMVKTLKYYGYDRQEILIHKKNPACKKCNGLGYLIDHPIICIESLNITKITTRRLLKMDPMHWEDELRKLMVSERTTGVHDALEYLNEGRVSWLHIWDFYSLGQMVDIWLEDESRIEKN